MRVSEVLQLDRNQYTGKHLTRVVVKGGFIRDVVPMQRDEACPEDLLVDAAHLAVHFSAARAEPVVEVSYTSKRYVRKPRGAAPGKVTLEREKVIAVHMEPERIKRLLGCERFD